MADCDYITKLIPPKEFEAKKSALAAKMQSFIQKVNPYDEEDDRYILELDNGSTLHFHNASKWMLFRPSWLGTERYAMEHWLGSHPDMKPCDVFSPKNGVPSFSYDNMKRQRVFAGDLVTKIEVAPGIDFKEFWYHPYRLHPWYKQTGNLYQYQQLYSKVPSQLSWFYKFWKGVPLYK